jgi:hypothetical protein
VDADPGSSAAGDDVESGNGPSSDDNREPRSPTQPAAPDATGRRGAPRGVSVDTADGFYARPDPAPSSGRAVGTPRRQWERPVSPDTLRQQITPRLHKPAGGSPHLAAGRGVGGSIGEIAYPFGSPDASEDADSYGDSDGFVVHDAPSDDADDADEDDNDDADEDDNDDETDPSSEASNLSDPDADLVGSDLSDGRPSYADQHSDNDSYDSGGIDIDKVASSFAEPQVEWRIVSESESESAAEASGGASDDSGGIDVDARIAGANDDNDDDDNDTRRSSGPVPVWAAPRRSVPELLGRIDDLTGLKRALHKQCVDALGAETFTRFHAFLSHRSTSCDDDDVDGNDSDDGGNGGNGNPKTAEAFRTDDDIAEAVFSIVPEEHPEIVMSVYRLIYLEEEAARCEAELEGILARHKIKA